MPVDVDALGVDLLSIAGHKLYAPKGVGALYVRRGTPLRPFVLGAGHERGLRPGHRERRLDRRARRRVRAGAADLAAEAAASRALRDGSGSGCATAIPGLALNGHPTERLPNTLSVRFPGVSGTALLAAAPSVAASTGSACHEGHESAPAVVVAMGVAPTRRSAPSG